MEIHHEVARGGVFRAGSDAADVVVGEISATVVASRGHAGMNRVEWLVDKATSKVAELVHIGVAANRVSVVYDIVVFTSWDAVIILVIFLGGTLLFLFFLFIFFIALFTLFCFLVNEAGHRDLGAASSLLLLVAPLVGMLLKGIFEPFPPKTVLANEVGVALNEVRDDLLDVLGSGTLDDFLLPFRDFVRFFLLIVVAAMVAASGF